MKKEWIYYTIITLFMVAYDFFVIITRPSEPSLYVIYTWTLSLLLVYPVVSLISAILLRIFVVGWKKQIMLIVFSSPIFFIVSAIMISVLSSWNEENALRFTIEGSIRLALEAIIVQMLVIGLAELLINAKKRLKYNRN